MLCKGSSGTEGFLVSSWAMKVSQEKMRSNGGKQKSLEGANRLESSNAPHTAEAAVSVHVHECERRERAFGLDRIDGSSHKQGLFRPATRIPIHAPEKIAETRPDYVLILPWNIREEIIEQIAHIRSWGGRFVVPIPSVEVLA